LKFFLSKINPTWSPTRNFFFRQAVMKSNQIFLFNNKLKATGILLQPKRNTTEIVKVLLRSSIRLLTYFGTLWYHLCTTYVPLMYHFGTTYEPLWYHLCTTLVPLMYHFGTTYVPLMYHFGTTLMYQLKLTYVSVKTHFGAIQTHLKNHIKDFI
jgi:hypothetical protein